MLVENSLDQLWRFSGNGWQNLDFFSLKLTALQGRSSLKMSAHQTHVFHKSQGTNKQTNRLTSYCFREWLFVLLTQIICSTNYKVIVIACIFPTYHIGLTKKMNLLHVTYYHESKNHIKNYQNRTIDKYFCIVRDLLI